MTDKHTKKFFRRAFVKTVLRRTFALLALAVGKAAVKFRIGCSIGNHKAVDEQNQNKGKKPLKAI